MFANISHRKKNSTEEEGTKTIKFRVAGFVHMLTGWTRPLGHRKFPWSLASMIFIVERSTDLSRFSCLRLCRNPLLIFHSTLLPSAVVFADAAKCSWPDLGGKQRAYEIRPLVSLLLSKDVSGLLATSEDAVTCPQPVHTQSVSLFCQPTDANMSPKIL